MGKAISKSHNKTTLMYHLVCAIKYRRSVLNEDVTDTIVNVCMEIEENYGIEFIEIVNRYKSYPLFNLITTKIFSKPNCYDDKKLNSSNGV